MGIRTPVAGSEGRQDIQATLWAHASDYYYEVQIIFLLLNIVI